MRRTKILATLGPASNTEEVVNDLLTCGVDAFRLNFSHGTAEEWKRIIDIVRRAAVTVGRYVPIVGDIQGPKLRIGEVEGVIQLQNGASLTITTDKVRGNAQIV